MARFSEELRHFSEEWRDSPRSGTADIAREGIEQEDRQAQRGIGAVLSRTRTIAITGLGLYKRRPFIIVLQLLSNFLVGGEARPVSRSWPSIRIMQVNISVNTPNEIWATLSMYCRVLDVLASQRLYHPCGRISLDLILS